MEAVLNCCWMAAIRGQRLTKRIAEQAAGPMHHWLCNSKTAKLHKILQCMRGGVKEIVYHAV
jgi:hypothetical protein